MHLSGRTYIIGLLQEHICDTENLEYKDYTKAEELYHRLCLHAGKYFADRPIYIQNLTGIKFRMAKASESVNLKVWQEGKGRMIAIARAMIDDLNYPENVKNNPKHTGSFFSFRKSKVIAVIIFIVLSVILWTFNSRGGWEWLNTHPKRISIYLSVQILVLVGCLILFITQGKKKIGAVEVIGIVAPLLYGIVSVLDR